MRKNKFLSAVPFIFSFLLFPSVKDGVLVKAEEDTFQKTTLVEGTFYQIHSDGQPLYLSFQAASDLNETFRFSYALKEFNVISGGVGQVGTFVTTSSHVDNGYDSDQFVALRDVDNCDPHLGMKIGVVSSLLGFKGSPASDVNYIMRDGVGEYVQTSFGILNNNFASDLRYGLYFDGLSFDLSFLFMYGYGSDYVLHYAEGVTISSNNDSVTPTIVSEDFTISNEIGLGKHPVYNSKYCYLPFTKNEVSDEYIVEFDHFNLNNQEIENLSLRKDGEIYYVCLFLNNDDELEIICSKTYVRVDTELNVYNLVDASNQKYINFTQLRARLGVGNIPNVPNTAFEFILHTPHVSQGMWVGERQTKFGIWTNNASLWSNFGYIVIMSEVGITLSTGEEVPLAKKSSPLLKPNSSIKVLIGLSKIYNESNHYIGNRFFAKLNDEMVIFYDDMQFSSLGSVVTGPYIGEAGGECAFEDARSADLLEITDRTNSEFVTLCAPRYILKNESLELSFLCEDGYRFNKLFINNVETPFVYNDGFYVASLDSVSEDINITYSLLENVHASIRVTGEHVYASYDGYPLFGSKQQIKFTISKGYVLDKIRFNDQEKDIAVLNDDGSFSFYYLANDNFDISIEVVEKSFAVKTHTTVEHVTIKFSTDSVLAGDDLSFSIKVDDGYCVQSVKELNGLDIYENGGVYFIYNVYQDIEIDVSVMEITEMNVEEKAVNYDWVAFIIYGVSGLVVISLATILIILMRKKKQ